MWPAWIQGREHGSFWCFQVLLLFEDIRSSLGFNFQCGLHGFKGASKVLSGAFKFLILFVKFLVDFSLDLGKVELEAKDTALLKFKSSFGFFKGALHLIVFSFSLLLGFLDFVQ